MRSRAVSGGVGGARFVAALHATLLVSGCAPASDEVPVTPPRDGGDTPDGASLPDGMGCEAVDCNVHCRSLGHAGGACLAETCACLPHGADADASEFSETSPDGEAATESSETLPDDGGAEDGDGHSAVCPGLSADGPVVGYFDTYAAYAIPGTERRFEYPRFAAPRDVFDYYNEERARYYRDGVHVFEPRTLAWDDALADHAQAYALELAAACATPSPVGTRAGESEGKDPYWAGHRAGILVAAGVEHLESWRNFNPISGEFFCWYSTSTSSWRAGYLRFDACEGCGYTRLGVGVAHLDERQRWVVFAWR